MKSMAKVLMVVALGVLICLPGMASATFITSTAGFGSGTVTEGFEGITPGSTNTSTLYNGNWFNINVTPPYNFGNGATLSAPPAVAFTTDNAGPYIHDFSLNGGVGTIEQVPFGTPINNAPFGAAYLGIWRDHATGPFSLTFKFDQDVIRAGAYFTGWPEGDTSGTQTYIIRALDAAGNQVGIESYQISAGTVGNWANQFVGIELLSGFRQLEFSSPTYGQTVLDNLKFQMIPIPASVLLLGSALLGLGLLGWRRKQAS
jgi:hypothetical protein